MKVEKLIKTHQCDFCSVVDSYMSSCTFCGCDICYKCQKTKAVEYPHAVHFSGSGDGLYCLKCDAQAVHDPLHRAYVAVKDLRDQERVWCEAFKVKQTRADQKVERLRSKS